MNTDTPQEGPSQEETSQEGPLRDLVVLDFTLALAGPFATRLLSGLGARVIKVESPHGNTDPARGNAPFWSADGVVMRPEDGARSVPFLDRARGKQAITLDLKNPQAAEVIAALVTQADLVVQNWSPGVAERLGVDFASLAAINPAIVVASITGFGLDATEEEIPSPKAMDSIIQAMSGFMLSAGNPGDPPVMNGVPIADLVSPLFSVIGALAAVHEARLTGRGKLVDVSMLGALTALVAAEPYGAYEALGRESRPGLSVARLAPFGVYPTQDGHVALCAPTDSFASELLELIGAAADDRFGDRPGRVTHHQELDDLIEVWTSARTTASAVEQLCAVGVPSAPVRTPAEAVSDPLVLRRGEVEPIWDPERGIVDGVVGPGVPIRFSGIGDATPEVLGPTGPACAPEVGEHNNAVYREMLGYDEQRLALLAQDGVI